jgi:hypothetical protein
LETLNRIEGKTMSDLTFKVTEKVYSVLCNMFEISSSLIYPRDIEVINVHKKHDTYVVSGRFKTRDKYTRKIELEKTFTMIFDKDGNFIEAKVEE